MQSEIFLRGQNHVKVQVRKSSAHSFLTRTGLTLNNS